MIIVGATVAGALIAMGLEALWRHWRYERRLRNSIPRFMR